MAGRKYLGNELASGSCPVALYAHTGSFSSYKVEHTGYSHLGENTAISLGIAVERELRLLLIASVALTSACVAVSGGVGFVGLVAPHMARRLIGGRHHALMPASMLLGALLLLLADTLGRSAFQPREIPVGIVISVLSAPYFLFLLRRYF